MRASGCGNEQYNIDRVWDTIEGVYRSYFDGDKEKHFFDIYNIIFKACAFYGETKELLEHFQQFIDSYMSENIVKIGSMEIFNSTFRQYQVVFKDISDTMLFVGSELITEVCLSAFARAVDSTIYDKIMDEFISGIDSLITKDDDAVTDKLAEFISVLSSLNKSGSVESERLVSICCEKLGSYFKSDSERINKSTEGQDYGWEAYLKFIQAPLVTKVKTLGKIKFDKEKKANLIKTYMLSLLNYKIKVPSWFVSDMTELANSPGIKGENSEIDSKKSPERRREASSTHHHHHHHHHHEEEEEEEQQLGDLFSGESTEEYSSDSSRSFSSYSDPTSTLETHPEPPVPVTPISAPSTVSPVAEEANSPEPKSDGQTEEKKGEVVEEEIPIRSLLSSSLLIHLYTENKFEYLAPCMMLFEYIFTESERNMSFKIFSRRILDKILKTKGIESEESKTCITSNSLIPLKSMTILNLLDERDNVIKFIKLLFHDFNQYSISEDVDVNTMQERYIGVFKDSFSRFLASNDEIGKELANFINYLLSGSLNHLMENVCELFSSTDGGEERDNLSAGFNEANIFLNNILNIYNDCSYVFSNDYYTTIFKRISMNYILSKKHIINKSIGSEEAAGLQEYNDRLLDFNIHLEKAVGEYMSKSENLQTVENGRKTVRMIEDIGKSIEICSSFNQTENKGLKARSGGFFIEPTIIRRNIWRDQLAVDIAEEVLKLPLRAEGEDLKTFPLLNNIVTMTESFEGWYKRDPVGIIACNKDGFQHSIDVIQYQGWARFKFTSKTSKDPSIVITAPITCGHIMVAMDDYETRNKVSLQDEKNGIKTSELKKLSRLPEKLFEGAFSSLFYARVLRCSSKNPMDDESIIYINPKLPSLASNGEMIVTFIDSIDFSDITDKKHEIVIIRATTQAIIMSHCKECKKIPSADLISWVRTQIQKLKDVEMEEECVKREIEEMIKKGNLERDGDDLKYVD